MIYKLAPLSFWLFPLYVIASWLMTFVAYLFAPLIATIAWMTGRNVVGGWLSYLCTSDASLDGGIEQNITGYRADATGWRLWWQRVCWICRNPAGKFKTVVLGVPEGVVIYRVGGEYPDWSLWTVVQSPSGSKWFGYRGRHCWFGWTFTPRQGYHTFKAEFWQS